MHAHTSYTSNSLQEWAMNTKKPYNNNHNFIIHILTGWIKIHIEMFGKEIGLEWNKLNIIYYK